MGGRVSDGRMNVGIIHEQGVLTLDPTALAQPLWVPGSTPVTTSRALHSNERAVVTLVRVFNDTAGEVRVQVFDRDNTHPDAVELHSFNVPSEEMVDQQMDVAGYPGEIPYIVLSAALGAAPAGLLQADFEQKMINGSVSGSAWRYVMTWTGGNQMPQVGEIITAGGNTQQVAFVKNPDAGIYAPNPAGVQLPPVFTPPSVGIVELSENLAAPIALDTPLAATGSLGFTGTVTVTRSLQANI